MSRCFVAKYEASAAHRELVAETVSRVAAHDAYAEALIGLAIDYGTRGMVEAARYCVELAHRVLRVIA